MLRVKPPDFPHGVCMILCLVRYMRTRVYTAYIV